MVTKLHKVKLLQSELFAFLEDVKKAKGFKAQIQYHTSAVEVLQNKIEAFREETLMRANRIMKLAVELEAQPQVIALAKEAIEIATAFEKNRLVKTENQGVAPD